MPLFIYDNSGIVGLGDEKQFNRELSEEYVKDLREKDMILYICVSINIIKKP